MLGNLRKIATGGASSVWKKFLTLTVAAGLAASMTLGATPVSATTASWEDWALEVDNSAPQWGDVVEFSAEIDWTSCKRIPIVYLLGTSDNGDPISVRLTGDQVTGKVYSYSISYGGVDEDGVPYDYELSSSERTTLNDTRLAAGWHSFQLKATSTRANCPSLNRVQYSDAVEFYVGPQLTGVEFTTNATYDFDVTSGLISVLDDNEDDFTTGIYGYELTSQVGDSSSGLWIEAGEIVGDTLTVDATAGIDWDNNLSGMNCYLDEPVDLVGDPVADGHHVVDDTDALDCAAIDIDLGEHSLTVERWIDSCGEAGLDCLSWTTFTFDFARVENQDAMPYVLDFTDASTGVSLLEDPYEWQSTDYTNTIFLDTDYSNGIEIVADLPFGADMSCIYESDDVELSAGDVFDPSELPGETSLVCTVTPEDPSAESFEYTVTIDRVSGDVGFSDLRVITDRRGDLDVSNSPMALYDVEVDYTAGIASRRDDTAGIELTLDDESADFYCYEFASYAANGDGAGLEADCAAFPLNTPEDGEYDTWPADYTTGVWIEIEAEDGTTEVWYLLVIESDDATLADLRVENVSEEEKDLYDDTNGVVIDFDEDIFEYHVFVTGSDLVDPGVDGLDVIGTPWSASATTDCYSGYVGDTYDEGDTLDLLTDCVAIMVPEDADDDWVVLFEVTGGSGRVNNYVVYFTYQNYTDGLTELEVDGVPVENDIDTGARPVVLDGAVFDGGSATTWYAVTDQATADVSFVLGDLPGLSAHCYREGVLADCENIALSVSDYTTVTVVTKTGGVGGTTKRTYTIEIYRMSTVKTLATLTANNGSAMTLSPSFSPTTYTYAASSVLNVIDVSFTTTSAFANAVCVDNDADSATPCQDINVNDGPAVVTITVTAENGATQVYTLNLSKTPPMPAPEYLARAAVQGTATSGSTLTAATGSWIGQPTYAYQWFRCNTAQSLKRGAGDPAGCAAIGGATAPTYRLVAADKTKFVLVKITGTNAGGSTVIYTNSTRAVR